MVTKLDLYYQMKGEQPSGKRKKIAVVDDFTNKSVYIDLDNKPDISHGEVVSRFLEEGLPDAEIVHFDTKRSKQCSGDEATKLFKSQNEQLDKLIKEIENGKKYDALNFSFSTSLKFNEVVDSKNISSKKAELREALFKENSHESWKELSKVIKKLDYISSKGLPLYIAAGNEGPKNYNLYDLANNSISVGSLDKKGKKAKFSADNSAVDKWEQGIFDIKHITDKNGNKGFDYTGDGIVDITDEKTTAWLKMPNPFKLFGTSVSTPKAIVKELK